MACWLRFIPVFNNKDAVPDTYCDTSCYNYAYNTNTKRHSHWHPNIHFNLGSSSYYTAITTYTNASSAVW